MKPVQVLFDEALLADLDRDERVQKLGRSEVLRELAARYLAHRRRTALDASYRAGYGDGAAVSEELTGWDEEGTWSDE